MVLIIDLSNEPIESYIQSASVYAVTVTEYFYVLLFPGILPNFKDGNSLLLGNHNYCRNPGGMEVCTRGTTLFS